MIFLWEQHVVKKLYKFENGCILMHCDAWVVI